MFNSFFRRRSKAFSEKLRRKFKASSLKKLKIFFSRSSKKSIVKKTLKLSLENSKVSSEWAPGLLQKKLESFLMWNTKAPRHQHQHLHRKLPHKNLVCFITGSSETSSKASSEEAWNPLHQKLERSFIRSFCSCTEKARKVAHTELGSFIWRKTKAF